MFFTSLSQCLRTISHSLRTPFALSRSLRTPLRRISHPSRSSAPHSIAGRRTLAYAHDRVAGRTLSCRRANVRLARQSAARPATVPPRTLECAPSRVRRPHAVMPARCRAPPHARVPRRVLQCRVALQHASILKCGGGTLACRRANVPLRTLACRQSSMRRGHSRVPALWRAPPHVRRPRRALQCRAALQHAGTLACGGGTLECRHARVPRGTLEWPRHFSAPLRVLEYPRRTSRPARATERRRPAARSQRLRPRRTRCRRSRCCRGPRAARCSRRAPRLPDALALAGVGGAVVSQLR